MSHEIKSLYDFENFRLDLAEKVLLRDGKFISITPKVFETLQIFVENAGRLIEKDELMQKLWHDQFVEESNLTFNIKMLRKALRDNAAKPRFIETVPRRGYRFIADVRRTRKEGEKGRREEDENGELRESHSSTGSLAHFPSHKIPSSAVVALADWRHKLDETGPEENNLPPPRIELVPDKPVTSGGRRYLLLLLAGTICAVGLAALGLNYFSGSETSDFQRSDMNRLTSNGRTTRAAVSPDGKFIAYVVDDNGRHSLWLKNIATGSDTTIVPESENIRFGNATFSPDGDHIFYNAKGDLFRMPLLGGSSTKIVTDISDVVSFSPDGKQIAFVRYLSHKEEASVIVIADTVGTNERTVASSNRPNLFLRSAAWSPDGSLIACSALTAEGHQEIVVVRVADGAISTIPGSQADEVNEVVWRPDGRGLLMIVEEPDNILFQIWSVDYPGGAKRKITDDAHNYSNISLSADGRVAASVQAAQETHLWLLPAGEDATRAKQLTHGTDKYDGFLAINWTNDDRIIYENAPNGHPAVWAIDSNGSRAKEILKASITAASPDGNFVVYQSDDPNGTGLFRFDVKDGQRIRLTRGVDIYPTVSPDARSVVFLRFADDTAIWKVPLEGGDAVKLTNFPGFLSAPAISPDGRFIAFNRSTLSAPFETLTVVSMDSGEIINEFDVRLELTLNHGKRTVQWTPDGQAINFVSLQNNVSNIWRQPVDGSPPVQVTNFESGRIFNFAYSPDGKQLALSRGSFNRDVVLISKFD